MNMSHVQLSIRSTYVFLLVVGIWLCVGIHLIIQGWYSKEEGGEGGRVGGKEGKRQRETKREKNTESKRMKWGGEGRERTNPLGMHNSFHF